MSASLFVEPGCWRREGRDLLRGTAGGLIFGTPLLYTMEVWERGKVLAPLHMLVFLGLILLFNIVFSLFSGLREENANDQSPLHAISDGITSVGLALVLSFVVLLLIGQISFESLQTVGVGMILVEALVISVGITFTNVRFNGANRSVDTDEPKGESSEGDRARRQSRADRIEAAASIGGAFVFSMNVAPTEEILKIASGLGPLHQLVLFSFEVVVCYIILYASQIGQLEVHVEGSLFQSPVAETLMTVAAGLLVAGALLLLVGYPGTIASAEVFVSCLISLGLPAIIGGAAGRLAV